MIDEPATTETIAAIEEQIEQLALVEVCPLCGIKVAGLNVCPNDGTSMVPDLVPGAVVANRYEIVEEVGRGGMSNIYKAKQLQLDRCVALKMLHTYLLTDTSHLKRFAREARTVSQLAHPNIVAVHDFGITNHGQPFLIMDYLERGSLSDHISKCGPLKPDQAIAWLAPVCNGFAHAHSKGILHRDIKPSNLMLDVDATGKTTVKIVDFGIAKLAAVDEKEAQKLTKTGEVIGSPYYMSPEQCIGAELDPRSDIYSMGCVLYEALAGQPPYRGANSLETIYKQSHEGPPRIKGIPNVLENVVLKALAKDPAQRFQSMLEFERALDAVRTGKAKPMRSLKRRPPYAVIAALVVFSLAALLIKAKHEVNNASTTQSAPKQQQAALIDNGEKLSSDRWLEYLVKNKKRAEALFLAQSDLTNAGMHWVSKLPGLRSLDIAYTAVSDDGLRDLHQLPKLTYFEGSGTTISDEGAASLAQVKAIEHLSLMDNRVTDKGLAKLAELPHLKYLRLGENRLSERDVAAIGKFSALQELNLYHVIMPPHSVAAVTRQPELRAFDGELDGLTAADLQELPQSLSGLNLSSNKLDESCMQILQTHSGLKKLALRNCSLNDRLCTHLRGLPLETLILNNNEISDQSLAWIGKNPNIRSLWLSDTKISDRGLACLSNAYSLTELRLDDDAKVTDAGVLNLAKLRGLERLSLRGTSITDKSLAIIVRCFPNLKSLNLEDTQITNLGLRELNELPKLKRLYLAGTKVTVRDLRELDNLTLLQRLWVPENVLSTPGIGAIQNRIPHTQIRARRDPTEGDIVLTEPMDP